MASPQQIVKNRQTERLNAEKAPLPSSDLAPSPKEQGSQESGTNHLFTQALLGILPTIGGAIFGGSEGAAAGAQVGLKGIEQYNKAIVDQQNLDLKREELDLNKLQFKEARASRLAELGDKFAEIKYRSDLEMQQQAQQASFSMALESTKNENQERAQRIQITNQIAQDALKPLFDPVRTVSGNVVAMRDLTKKYEGSANDVPIGPEDALGAAYNYLKTMDPNSAVLLSELENVTNLSGLLGKWEEGQKSGESEDAYGRRISVAKLFKDKFGKLLTQSKLSVGNLRQLNSAVQAQKKSILAGRESGIRALMKRADEGKVDRSQATMGLSELLDDEEQTPQKQQDSQLNKIDISKLSLDEKKKLRDQIKAKKGAQ
jgi:hypothetical protein